MIEKIKAKMTKKTFLLIGALIITVFAAVFFAISSKTKKEVNFKNIYSVYCSPVWAKLSEDGNYLSVDTNPRDKSSQGMANPEAYKAVEGINKALKLPSNLMDKMDKTSYSDGKQTETFEDLGIEVSWIYYPDKGLEVTYKKMST